MDFFYSDDPQEIEDEKKKQECYRQYLPQLMGEKDETKYILVRYNTLNEDGFTKEEITKINKKEEEEQKKRMEFSEIAKNWRTKK